MACLRPRRYADDDDGRDDGPDESDLRDLADDDDDSPAETSQCPECGREIYLESERCPHCGMFVTPERRVGRWVLVTLVLLLAAMLILALRLL